MSILDWLFNRKKKSEDCGGSHLPDDWRDMADMKDTPMKTPLELEILQYILRGDKSRITRRAYTLELPRTLESLTYARNLDEGSMNDNRDFARKMFKRHGFVLTEFRLAETYTCTSNQNILMRWKKRKTRKTPDPLDNPAPQPWV